MYEKSSFALIVPCYNEELAILEFHNELADFIQKFTTLWSQFELQVVIVDNNSTDQSPALLKQLAQELSPTVRIMTCQQQGYGAALKAGFAKTEADWYSFSDLDNTYPLAKLNDMLAKAEQHNLDIVFGNRLELKTEMPFIRKLGNTFYSLMSKILFQKSPQDMCTGMRVFRAARRAEVVALKSNDLKFSIEFTAVTLKRNWRFAEIPISYRYRLGDSKLSIFSDGFLFLFILLKVRWFMR